MRSDLHAADLALRDRILSGDRDEAETLFREQIDTLYEFVYYRVGRDVGRAEDIVQDTILVAFERLAQFDGRSTLHTWMCGIAKNKIRSQARKRRSVPIEDLLEESEGEIDAILTRIEQEPLPDEIIEARETSDLVGATMSSLPPHYRAALTSKYIDGESVNDLSRRSGRNPKAVESTLHRARQAFSRIFQLLAAGGSETA